MRTCKGRYISQKTLDLAFDATANKKSKSQEYYELWLCHTVREGQKHCKFTVPVVLFKALWRLFWRSLVSDKKLTQQDDNGINGLF